MPPAGVGHAAAARGHRSYATLACVACLQPNAPWLAGPVATRHVTSMTGLHPEAAQELGGLVCRCSGSLGDGHRLCEDLSHAVLGSGGLLPRALAPGAEHVGQPEKTLGPRVFSYVTDGEEQWIPEAARKFPRARRAGDNGLRLCPMCGPTTRRTPWERPDGSAAAARRRRPTTASAPTPERGRGARTKSGRPTAANAAASLLARRRHRVGFSLRCTSPGSAESAPGPAAAGPRGPARGTTWRRAP